MTCGALTSGCYDSGVQLFVGLVPLRDTKDKETRKSVTHRCNIHVSRLNAFCFEVIISITRKLRL